MIGYVHALLFEECSLFSFHFVHCHRLLSISYYRKSKCYYHSTITTYDMQVVNGISFKRGFFFFFLTFSTDHGSSNSSNEDQMLVKSAITGHMSSRADSQACFLHFKELTTESGSLGS